MTPDERRTSYNIYMKQYMRDKRIRVVRICPDCGVNELDKGYSYCSECAGVRKYFRDVTRDHNWIKNNPEKYKIKYTRENLKRDRRKSA